MADWWWVESINGDQRGLKTMVYVVLYCNNVIVSFDSLWWVESIGGDQLWVKADGICCSLIWLTVMSGEFWFKLECNNYKTAWWSHLYIFLLASSPGSSAEGQPMRLPFCFGHREDINGSHLYLKIKGWLSSF